ncbi:MAG TPA: efflux RND transporter periplasmic adaptor subunit [Thermoanaerobaculia bacterium]|nr:efflux RND transporter periplasmic adaptor subunit [Thermoanaerobaculia bacterium]
MSIRFDVASRTPHPLLVSAAAVALLAACGGKKPPAEKPRTVRLVPAARRPLPKSITAVGTLAAEDKAELSFKVPGRLEKLFVDIGSSVVAGAVLARLEREEYAYRVEGARAALLQARARLGLPPDGAGDEVEAESTAVVRQNRARMEQAKAELVRSQSLLDQGLLSRSAFDVAEANFKVADSQYNDSLEEVNNRRGILLQRRSDLAIAEQQLRDTSLVAPFSGGVQARRANLGEYVLAGAPVLSLVKTSPIRLRLEIPEREARYVAKGLPVTVRREGDTGAFTGTVARISPALEESNRSLIVEAEIPNPNGALRPGAFVRAEIVSDAGGPALVVPSSSVVVFAGIEKVVTVREKKALERPVVTGRRTPEAIEIVSGLADGDLVVEKPGNLATGMPVQPESGAAETAPRPTAATPPAAP